MSVKRALFITDRHFPYQDVATDKALKHYLGDNEFDYIIDGGDLCDFDVISSHNKENLRAVEGKSIKQQYDCVNRELDILQKLQPKAAITLIEGNHDYRIERYLNLHPEGVGMLEVPVGLKLADRGIEWVPYWSKDEVKTIGKANFGHGTYMGKHHAFAHADAYGINFFYGHVHDTMAHPVKRRGDNSTYVAQSCGCLCSYQQSYLRGRPTKWQQAFAEFWFRDDSYFNYNLVQIFNNSFVASGRLYTPRGSSKI